MYTSAQVSELLTRISNAMEDDFRKRKDFAYVVVDAVAPPGQQSKAAHVLLEYFLDVMRAESIVNIMKTMGKDFLGAEIADTIMDEVKAEAERNKTTVAGGYYG